MNGIDPRPELCAVLALPRQIANLISQCADAVLLIRWLRVVINVGSARIESYDGIDEHRDKRKRVDEAVLTCPGAGDRVCIWIVMSFEH